MATTTFVDNVTPVVAAWLNDVDAAVYSNVINVQNSTYGAVGNGIADDTAAINAAIAACAAAGGGTVFFPAGTYRCTSNITITSNYVRLVGTGKYGSRLFFTTTSGSCLRFSGSSLAMCGVASLGIYVTAATTGTLLETSGVFRFSMEDVFLNGAVGSTNYPAGLCLLSGTDVYCFNTEMVGFTSHGLWLNGGNDYFISDVTVQGNGVLGNSLYISAVTAGAVLMSNCVFLEGANSFLQNSSYITINNTYFDSAQGATSVSGCTHVYLSNTEAANRVTTGTGDGGGWLFGTSKNFVLTSSMIINCGSTGITVNSDCSDFIISNNHIDGNNTTNAANRHGILVGGGALNFSILGNRIGNITAGFVGRQKYGIALGAGASNYYIIKDNICLNNDTGGLIDNGTGLNAIVENNPGYNPIGLSVVAAPASTVTYQAGHTSETIYLTGGTVTAVKIPNNAGSTVFTTTPCSLQLGPNETFSITYTVAPTMSRQRH